MTTRAHATAGRHHAAGSDLYPRRRPVRNGRLLQRLAAGLDRRRRLRDRGDRREPLDLGAQGQSAHPEPTRGGDRCPAID